MIDLNFNEYMLILGAYYISVLLALSLGYIAGLCKKNKGEQIR
jgi:hypothetical protein